MIIVVMICIYIYMYLIIYLYNTYNMLYTILIRIQQAGPGHKQEKLRKPTK